MQTSNIRKIMKELRKEIQLIRESQIRTESKIENLVEDHLEQKAIIKPINIAYQAIKWTIGASAIITSLVFGGRKAFAAQVDVDILRHIPRRCKYVISSGHRSHDENIRVGGAKNSFHLYDRARDVVFKSTSCKKKVFDNIRKSELTVILYPSHLHIDNRANKKCLVKVKGGYRYCNKRD